mmetsp:Transcript_26242/g.36552  ORF Transcript_26242/g.36552 Transcript_26242/m.36552 type:complete len:425 (+) Transcript_26242:146-1420(+)|eukprot:CAMPEP_0184478324 /NCGR_PEP_ID=MMETSP0113_2-20130426/381_1 /TAXON_ID=91329 /ORGANISM="Norrisiella sphaerica, Strain BC52" /LENGTH=424 /DNA_ID=CAMNT_0026856079 /DNA_START=152 /DNA_END=1426 /DNA_ORIENTATION=+
MGGQLSFFDGESPEHSKSLKDAKDYSTLSDDETVSKTINVTFFNPSKETLYMKTYESEDENTRLLAGGCFGLGQNFKVKPEALAAKHFMMHSAKSKAKLIIDSGKAKTITMTRNAAKLVQVYTKKDWPSVYILGCRIPNGKTIVLPGQSQIDEARKKSGGGFWESIAFILALLAIFVSLPILFHFGPFSGVMPVFAKSQGMKADATQTVPPPHGPPSLFSSVFQRTVGSIQNTANPIYQKTKESMRDLGRIGPAQWSRVKNYIEKYGSHAAEQLQKNKRTSVGALAGVAGSAALVKYNVNRRREFIEQQQMKAARAMEVDSVDTGIRRVPVVGRLLKLIRQGKNLLLKGRDALKAKNIDESKLIAAAIGLSYILLHKNARQGRKDLVKDHVLDAYLNDRFDLPKVGPKSRNFTGDFLDFIKLAP